VAANHRLRTFALVVAVANVVATIVAIIANWPSQFGQVGTDAGEEFVLTGTAISAPLLPMVLFVIVVALATRSGGLGWGAIGAAYAVAILTGIGAYGELVAEPTADTPRSVLLAGGLAWALIALGFLVLATMAAAERRRAPQSGARTVA